MRVSRAALGALALATVGAVWLYISVPPFLDSTVERAAIVMLDASQGPLAGNDELKIFVCGSSSPAFSAQRAQACIGVVADGRFYLIDSGDGSWRNILAWGIPVSKLSGIFVTHLHSDHIGDIGEANIQSWMWGRKNALPIYGPPGIKEFAEHSKSALMEDYRIRSGMAGDKLMPLSAALMRPVPLSLPPTGAHPIFKRGALKVSAFAVDHRPVEPAYGYLISYKGRTVVVSGDTTYSPNLVAVSRGADLLLHEALNERLVNILAKAADKQGNELAAIAGKGIKYHTTLAQAGQIYSKTKPRKMVLYHLIPPPDNFVVRRFYETALPTEVELSRDGQIFVLPANSTQIVERDLTN